MDRRSFIKSCFVGSSVLFGVSNVVSAKPVLLRRPVNSPWRAYPQPSLLSGDEIMLSGDELTFDEFQNRIIKRTARNLGVSEDSLRKPIPERNVKWVRGNTVKLVDPGMFRIKYSN